MDIQGTETDQLLSSLIVKLKKLKSFSLRYKWAQKQ